MKNETKRDLFRFSFYSLFGDWKIVGIVFHVVYWPVHRTN